MTNSEDTAEVLIGECESAIEGIRAEPGARSCPAHAHMARGLVALLRCETVRLKREQGQRKQSRAQWAAVREWLWQRALALTAITAALVVGVAVGRGETVTRLIEWVLE